MVLTEECRTSKKIAQIWRGQFGGLMDLRAVAEYHRYVRKIQACSLRE